MESTAIILHSDGTQLETGKTIKDPLGYMADQGVDDVGHCYLDGGVYWVIQAPCESSGGTSSGGGIGSLFTVSPTVYSV